MRSRYGAISGKNMAGCLDEVSAQNRELEASQRNLEEELRASEAQVAQLSARTYDSTPSSGIYEKSQVQALRSALQAAQDELTAYREGTNQRAPSASVPSDTLSLTAEMRELRRELNVSRKSAARQAQAFRENNSGNESQTLENCRAELAAAKKSALSLKDELAASQQESNSSVNGDDSANGINAEVRELRRELTVARRAVARQGPSTPDASPRKKDELSLARLRAELATVKQEAASWKASAQQEESSAALLLRTEVAQKECAITQLKDELAASREAMAAAAKAPRKVNIPPIGVKAPVFIEPAAKPAVERAGMAEQRLNGNEHREECTPRSVQATPRTHLKTQLQTASPAKGGRAHIWRQIEEDFRLRECPPSP